MSKPECVTTMEMGKIYIDSKTTAGTKIKIIYKSSDRLATQFETEFVVEKIDQVQSEVVFTSNGAVCDSSKFNVVVDKDSENVLVTSECRQLYVGRSTIVQIKYKGMSLDEYGLQIGNATTSENTTLTMLENNCIQLTLAENASGHSTIDLCVEIVDGEESYQLDLAGFLNAFRPMTGAPNFEIITSMSAQIPIANMGDFDQNATYGLGDLKYVGENSNNSTVSERGFLTLNKGKSNVEQWFSISCEQIYNDTTIFYQQKLCTKLKYVKFDHNGGTSSLDNWVLIKGFYDSITIPTKEGYAFVGYYCGDDIVIKSNGEICSWNPSTDVLAHWSPIVYKYVLRTYVDGSYNSEDDEVEIKYDEKKEISAPGLSGKNFNHFIVNSIKYTDSKLTIFNFSNKQGEVVYIDAYYSKSCVASGTMITLFDGTRKAVEDLDGSEQLLVWNLFTGEFDFAPILFIESHGEKTYEILNLIFEDETNVEVIEEHGFWDCDQSKYVYLNAHNVAEFVGHYFDEQFINEFGQLQHKSVKLAGFEIYEKHTNSWSPVTYGHLCYYVDGMLSVPSETQGFTNIFDVDSSSMQIDAEKMKEDIEKFGLFDYEIDFKGVLPKTIYDAFCGDYLKVSISKGNMTIDEINFLIEKYSKFFGEEGV